MKLETENTIDQDIIIVTTKTVEKLLSVSPDSLSLYLFYIKNAKIQKTNSIWNTNTFGMKGLNWGNKRYNDAKKLLVDNGFIEETIRRNDKGQIIGHYLKINYIFGRETVEDIKNNQKYQNPQVDITTSGFGEINALSNKTINALSNKKESNDFKSIGTLSLPTEWGKSPVQRVLYFYRRNYYNKYEIALPSALYGRSGKVIKELLVSYTEIQLSYLLIVFFSWKGMNDNNDKELNFLSSSGFNLSLFKSKVDQFEIYVKNICGYKTEFDNSDALLDLVVKHFLNL